MKMKRVLGLILLLAVVAAEMPLRAQSFEFDLNGRHRNGTVRIGLKGIEVDYGRREQYEGHPMVWGMGFNMLRSPDYSMYNEADHGFFELDVARSQRWFITPFHAAVAFNSDATFGLVSGLGIVWNNYVFDQNITVARVDGLLMPFPLDKNYKKTKLTTVSLSVPVELEAQFPSRNAEDRRFFVAGGLLGEVVLGAHTKYKKPKHKQKGNLDMTPFQAALSVRAGYGGVSIFCHYYLTSLFENNKGPEMQGVTFGVGFNL